MASVAYDPPHFLHVDKDGDKLEAFETSEGSVFYAWGTDGEKVAIALHSGADTQALIDYLTTVQEAQA
ncbi:hypothetical protein [Paenarthrobacter ureafaciens]|uniref:hypothetical protein n=1 Tax=Paenarthrobacter ureafaciens TaxID=37931 RepID=UPI001FB41C8A|nr:hypothetical protein [Paenarthrobacter ureafaciens]UOD80326.1 hypothetical protein MQZ73_14555 [Paenarthrobacter ureafaciens]WNZ02978.1 hypothetical protein PVT25_15190 [Paenarthrobacter ureafaciens]